MVQGSPLSPWTSSICQATDAAQYKCDSLKYSCLECDYAYGECYCFSAGNVQHEALLVLIKYLYCVQASAGPQQLKSISFVALRSQRMRYKCIHPSLIPLLGASLITSVLIAKVAAIYAAYIWIACTGAGPCAMHVTGHLAFCSLSMAAAESAGMESMTAQKEPHDS